MTRPAINRCAGRPNARRLGGPRLVAFTLIELLVVIGIIAVLLGLLLSVLARVRQAANNVRCLSNLRRVAQALRMYTNANGDRLPFSYMLPQDGHKYGYPTFDWWGPDWTYLIAPYLGSHEAVGHKQGHRENKALNDADTIEPTFVADWFDAGAVSHYTAHAKVFGYNPFRYTPAGSIYKPYRLSEIKRSSEIVLIWDSPQLGDAWGPMMDGVYAADAQADMLGETDFYGPYWIGYPPPPWYPFAHTGPNPGANLDFPREKEPVNGVYYFRTFGAENNMVGQFRWRHMNNRVCNFLFADGHVGGMRYSRFDYGGSDLTWANLMLSESSSDQTPLVDPG